MTAANHRLQDLPALTSSRACHKVLSPPTTQMHPEKVGPRFFKGVDRIWPFMYSLPQNAA